MYVYRFLAFNSLLAAAIIGFAIYHPLYPPQLQTNKLDSSLFNEQGFIQQPLRALLSELGIEHDGTIETVVAGTQKSWLRPSGQERWEMADPLAHYKGRLLPLFDQLGMVQAMYPAQKQYTYAVILGSLYTNVKNRLVFLIHAWQQGLRFKKLIFLTGARPLRIDEQEALQSKISSRSFATETDMMQAIYETMEMSDDFRKVPLVVVDAQAQQGARRPTTADTIKAWLTLQPEPGSIIAISSQPHLGYQQAVLKTFLPKSFSVETVGRAALETTRVSEYLDALARWLYCFYHQLKFNSYKVPSASSCPKLTLCKEARGL